MDQQFAELDGLTLAYREQNPRSPDTIFFIHGISCSSALWRKQFEDPLFSQYRLIAFDLPAHGHSSASDDAENDYHLPALGKILATAIGQLAPAGNYMLVSFSLGTNIAAEALAYLTDPKGLLFAGSCLIGEEYDFAGISLPGIDTAVLFTENAPEEAVIKYYTSSLSRCTEEEILPFIEDYRMVRSPFRSTLFRTAMEGKISDEIQLLRECKLPALFVFGKEETAVNPDYLDNARLNLWRDTIYKLSGAGHFVTMEQPCPFNQLLAEYAGEMFRAARC